MQACPYDAITLHPESGTATKCNYCAHRIDVGREPACVVVCPAEAIITGDLSDPHSKIARLHAQEQTSVRRPEKGTHPKLAYIDGDRQALDPFAARRASRTLWGERPLDAVDRQQELSAGLGDGSLARFVEKLGTPASAAQRTGGTDSTSDSHISSKTGGVAAAYSTTRRTSVEFPGPTSSSGPVRTFDIAQRHAASWGWKVSGYLFTKSIAAGAFLVPAVLGFAGMPEEFLSRAFSFGVTIALIFLAVTGGLLVADLKRPERFHWVLLRPQWSSWLVRGAYIITAYGLFLTGWFLFPGSPGGGWSILGGILSAATASYSGWLFGQAKGRDLWQSPLVPVHLLVQAFVAGCATLLIFSPRGLSDLAPILAIAVGVDALLIVAELHGRHASEAASRARRLLVSGSRRWWLYGASLALGHLLAISLLWSENPIVCTVAALLALAGVAIYEHLWIDTPQRLPLA